MRTANLVLPFVLLLLWPAAELPAQQPAGEEGRSRFRAFDVFVDSGSTPLAAYQVNLAATNGVARIVGVEGGDHPAFLEPPVYDPEAMQQDRVIIAAFSTVSELSLPKGKTRVATIHVQTQERQTPQFRIQLEAAGNARAERIPASASYEERKMP